MAKLSSKLTLLVVTCFCLVSVASAGTIVMRPADPAGSPVRVGEDYDPGTGMIELDQVLAVSWNQPFTLTNWNIEAYNVENSDPTPAPQPMTIRFELRMDSPLGALIYGRDMDPIAPGTTVGTLPLFSFADAGGVNLAPGTYYVIASAENYFGSWWTGDLTGANDVLAPGVTFGPEYVSTISAPFATVFPDSPGFVGTGFAVYGDIAVEPIPEPATFVLVGAGLLFAGAVARRRRQQHQ